MMVLRAEVERVVTRYLTLVDAAVPGAVAGLYLVGSVALDDFCPGTSDVDFVAVTSTPVSEQVRQALATVHHDLAAEIKAPAFEGIYLTADELRDSPVQTNGLQHHDGKLTLTAGGRSPVEWTTLARHGVAVRGPDPAELGVFVDAAELTAWTLGNLDRYWMRWIAQGMRPVSRTAVAMLTDWGIAWSVLGISRLCYTAATGQITSKTGAGRYALDTFADRWHGIVYEALRCRGARPGLPAIWRMPWQRRGQAMAFLQTAADECRRHCAARSSGGPASGTTR